MVFDAFGEGYVYVCDVYMGTHRETEKPIRKYVLKVSPVIVKVSNTLGWSLLK